MCDTHFFAAAVKFLKKNKKIEKEAKIVWKEPKKNNNLSSFFFNQIKNEKDLKEGN